VALIQPSWLLAEASSAGSRQQATECKKIDCGEDVIAGSNRPSDLNLVGVRRFEPASPPHQCSVTVRDLSNLDGWYALFAYQLCTSHNHKFVQSFTSGRCGG
jgi:hypothetical protein